MAEKKQKLCFIIIKIIINESEIDRVLTIIKPEINFSGLIIEKYILFNTVHNSQTIFKFLVTNKKTMKTAT